MRSRCPRAWGPYCASCAPVPASAPTAASIGAASGDAPATAATRRSAPGPAIYRDFLPAALAEGRYRAAPEPYVVGHGLQDVQHALDVQANGVSARKVVVSLRPWA